MSAHLLRTAAAAAVLSLAALGDARAQEAFASGDAPAVTSGAPAEVLKVDARTGSAYQVIARSNSAWLASRGPYEFPQRAHVVVYLDGLPIGGKQTLRGIQANGIAEIRHLDSDAATREFGVEHGAGAILLTSK